MILFTNILWVSIRLKLISNIDDAIVYNTTGANAAEARGDADIILNQNDLPCCFRLVYVG